MKSLCNGSKASVYHLKSEIEIKPKKHANREHNITLKHLLIQMLNFIHTPVVHTYRALSSM